MRKRFEQQLKIGQIPISQIKINTKYRGAFSKLVLSLKKLYLTPEYNERMFSILEDKIVKGKKKTGRPGMDLWVLFVMAQTRLCLNTSYDELHRMANNDKMFREIMGIETKDGFGGRKCMDIMGKFIRKYKHVTGWRKRSYGCIRLQPASYWGRADTTSQGRATQESCLSH